MSTGKNIERLTYRSSKHATRFAWKTVILAAVFGSSIFIILPLTAKKLEKKEKDLLITEAPARVKIKLPEKEKIFEKKNTVNNKIKKVEVKPMPPAAPKPPAVPVNIKLSPVSTEFSLKVSKVMNPTLNFKVEKIQAVQEVVKKPTPVKKAPPVSTPPSKNYNAIFSEHEVDTDAQIIKRAKPVYPRRALRRKVAGYVVIQCVITKEGRIANPIIVKATPKGYFEESCLDAIENVLYKPATLDGKPVAQRMELTFDFGIKR
ncbi:MAG: TonB family protein [Lentisphaeraceae bacterium]|nr:TonB family protein [Lentisphaeraceae bacterium]